MRNSLFQVIGSSSALTLLMLNALIFPGAIRGDISVIHRFFEQHPGSEPFVIFIMPVILICGLAWMWRTFLDWKASKNRSKT